MILVVTIVVIFGEKGRVRERERENQLISGMKKRTLQILQTLKRKGRIISKTFMPLHLKSLDEKDKLLKNHDTFIQWNIA